MNLYCVRDKISNRIYEVFMANSDAEAIRNTLPSLSRVKPKNDIQYYCLCQVDDKFDSDMEKDFSRFFANIEGSPVDMDSYHFDEITAEHISKTDAVQQIEQYRKSRELQLQKMQLEIQKAKKDLEVD